MEYSTRTIIGHSTSSVLLTIFISYVVYLIAGAFIRSQRLRVKAKKLNCEVPPALKNNLPLGIDQVTRALNALATRTFPPDTQQKHKEVNALTYKSSILGQDRFATIDEQNIKAILGTQFPDFDLGSHRINNLLSFLGPGIFAQDGEGWERSRALMRPQFARDNLSDLEMEERHFQVLLKAVPGTGQDGWSGEVDIQPLLFRFTLDTATEFLLGQSFESQLAGIKAASGVKIEETDVEAFAREFDIGNMSLSKRSKFAPYSWLIWPKGFSKAISTCHRVIDRIVAEHLQKLEASGGSKNPDRYVFFEALAEQTRDPTELRVQVLNILLAGRDTTSALLAFTILTLARDPVRCTKLREIILSEFGTFNETKNLTFADIKACKYLQWVLNESLRLYPVVPWNFRMANKDTTLPRGGGRDGKSKVFVKKGAMVEYSPYALHRRADIWGEDVDEFKPERWEGRKFNGGPRICLGQQYALTEAGFFIVRLLQKFDRVESVDQEEVTLTLALTMSSGNGVKIRLHEAEE
ncbi:hypothetical protein DSL72_008761 [Monilinia vaccinii-corymbosi]|uniref:Cytochrome P450 alkane hydroxylase n=1 Tax=Monilinia vaccinii-corymbosi TaxID=61207 RepID=A0A8A3PQ53_9HELO|nr:hypothetical protein DSL72_008761 [Monilinia vaccinii-corymbosi]